jgi:hypothetical protein
MTSIVSMHIFVTDTGVNVAKRAFSESVVIQIMHQTNERSFIFQIDKIKYISSLWAFSI